MIVDFLAIAPFYLSVLLQMDLRVLRVFRLIRFLKLARYSPALQTLGKVVVNERHALGGAAIVMCRPFAVCLDGDVLSWSATYSRTRLGRCRRRPGGRWPR